MEDLIGSRNPTTSPEACPLAQDPRAAKMWPGPSLPLPLLAAPPKGAATNSLRHSEAPGSGPEALGRAWGRESESRARPPPAPPPWRAELLGCTTKRLGERP